MWHKSLNELNLSLDDWGWIAKRGSLTEFLEKQAGIEKLDITLLEQGWRNASSEEQSRLLLDKNKILERKIVMTVMGQPWMFARTYFTSKASEYLGQALGQLSNNSLGILISKFYPELYRGDFEFCYYNNNSRIYADIIDLLKTVNLNIDTGRNIIFNKLITRRSIIYYDNLPFFNIDETFLPAFINKMLNLEVASYQL